VCLAWPRSPGIGAGTPAGIPFVAAAKKEGKVVVYSMALGAPYYLAVLKSFEAQIRHQGGKPRSARQRTRQRVRTEQAAGRFLGDAEIITTTMIEEQRKTGDYIQNVGTIPQRQEFARAVQGHRGQRACLRAADGDPGQYPHRQAGGTSRRAWEDLNDPKWKGKILSDDMRRSAAANTMFRHPAEKLGAAFNEKLAEQKRCSAATCA